MVTNVEYEFCDRGSIPSMFQITDDPRKVVLKSLICTRALMATFS